MIKVEYPKNICPNYEDLYEKIFQSELPNMQYEWDVLQRTNVELQQFPSKLSDIMLADYAFLVLIYETYKNLVGTLSKQVQEDLVKKVFNYDHWGADIACYFMEPSHGFNFSTCHYCDIAYVNAYKIDVVQDALFFMNTASDAELMRKLNTKSLKSINEYKIARPYHAQVDFNNIALKLGCNINKFDKTFRPKAAMRRHFDIEHVLPKSKCPLVGLSLYNFVPSCQVCNSKLKKTRVLGYGIPIEKLSPTSPMYNFDSNVLFKLVPKSGCKLSAHPTKDINGYYLDLDTSLDTDYEYNIKLFKLRERYNYHRIVALYWLEMKYRYTTSRITMIANAINDSQFSVPKIKTDIFQYTLDNSYHRVFGKLKQDILK